MMPMAASGPISSGSSAVAGLREARLVDIPGAALCHRSLYGEHAPLSRSVEHRFVLFDLDFAEAVHAIHVVHAVHQKILPHVDRVITYIRRTRSMSAIAPKADIR